METWRRLTRLCYFTVPLLCQNQIAQKHLGISYQLLYLRKSKVLRACSTLFNLHDHCISSVRPIFFIYKQIEVSCLLSLSIKSLFQLWLSNRSLLELSLSIGSLLPACLRIISLLEFSLSIGSLLQLCLGSGILLVVTLNIRSLLQVCLSIWKSLGRVLKQL